MMDQPLVTIIITTYNYAHTVGTAIESALRQDYPALEVLVVDNASTDATPQVVERYRSDARLRYVRNDTNIGMVPNHNKGLREARGSYVLFLSADDFLMPHHVSRSYAYLAAHPQTDVLYTSTYFVNEHERMIGLRQMGGQPLAAYEGGRNEFAGLLVEGCYMCFPTMLMRRDLYERFGELDEDIKAADYEIVVRWAANGVRFAYLPEPTCAVRLHSNQQSSAQNYVADAGDIREFVYLLEKFGRPHGELLDGYETSISRHMWSRFAMAKQSGVADADGSINATLLDMDRLLSAIRDANTARPRQFVPTVIVLPGNRAGEVERTLRSVAAQSLADWECLALEYAIAPFGQLADYLDPAGRIRPVRMSTMLPETSLVNQALRIARGNVFVVLRPGSTLPADHLERVVAALAEGHAEVVRTSASAAGMPVFIPPTEALMTYVVPFGPPEALAFTRRALDRAGGFNEQINAFADWEFYLRSLNQSAPIALFSTVDVAVASGAETFGTLAGLPAFARMLHNAYATGDPNVVNARAAYLRGLESAIAAGPPPADAGDGALRLLQAAYGTQLLAGAR